jgi:hypothetical protein
MEPLVQTGKTLARPAEPHAWLWLALVLLFFNFLDALLTLRFLQLGIADELNPFMRQAYQLSPAWFIVGKLGAVQLGMAVLFSQRSHPFARFGLAFCASVYGLIVLYQLAFAVRMTF